MAKEYKKLSVFGKSVWTGLLLATTLTRFDVNYIYFTGLILAILCIILAFSDKVYCKYTYKPEKDLDWTQKIFSVTGRISRLQYLGYVIVSVLATILMFSLPSIAASVLFLLFLGIPVSVSVLGAATRRSQDCGYNSWAPFIPFAMFVLLFIPGEKKDNQYGPVIKIK